ncbi:MAG: hypothetical protein J0I84_15645 [Terrimonas sp.]|nr:hypothetical protein [Terrimonas sp.]OJY92199.1 MAG: hypothetical protein BGP13_08530 [Sphingobacteriales bacterium 40-81]
MDNSVVSKIGLAVFGILFGSYVTTYLSRRRGRVMLAFDFHKELNNVDMAKHRRLAAKLIENNPGKDFQELSVIDEEQFTSVLMVMRFYQRLWLCVKHN